MPQMAPMLWLVLFFFFTLSFIIFMNLNYFISFSQPLTPTKLSEQVNKKIWKLY